MPKDFSIKPYVQAQGGAFQYQTPAYECRSSITINGMTDVFHMEKAEEYQTNKNFGLTVGATAQKGNAFADAGVTLGNKFRADVKAGYEFNLGSQMGLQLSAHAQHNANMPSSSNNTTITYQEHPFNIDFPPIDPKPLIEKIENAQAQTTTRGTSSDVVHSFTVSSDESIANVKNRAKYDERFSSLSFAGLGASVQYKPSWGTVGVGVEAGIKNTRSYVEVESSTSSSTMPELDSTAKNSYYLNNTTAYATPTFNASVNLGKGFSINADAQIREANVGVRKTF